MVGSSVPASEAYLPLSNYHNKDSWLLCSIALHTLAQILLDLAMICAQNPKVSNEESLIPLHKPSITIRLLKIIDSMI
jgi:hypothetical protein